MNLHTRCVVLCATTILMACGANLVTPTWADDSGDVQILGWVENVRLVQPDFEVEAKLDTGANTSSLDARIVKRFRKDGKRWVRFALRHPESGEEVVLVRERVRTIGIVQHEGDNDVRPTVRLQMCMAGMMREVEVSLVDRRNFRYPLLLGRRSLQGVALVDSGTTHLSVAECEDEPMKNMQ